ncbi:hypothetical protein GOC74_05105 [Halomicrobium mukohataei]|uniref:MCM C-terminal domain-containing protein n=1 Tax=Halomicrobium mukohataei TaxID=57705 RepID=A0A847UE01_9EURY|nr:hypothetical protein [Halomicrobium mukohataei]NLV09308.1 hypothetical protein [Halomicrobium mukohataei]
MNSQILEDGTSAFLTEEQDVGIVVHEDDGEILRLEGDEITFDELSVLRFIQSHEPVPLQEIRDEYDAEDPKVEEVIDELHHRGEVYQPAEGYYRVVQDAVDN